jgi:hypothetical protein
MKAKRSRIFWVVGMVTALLIFSIVPLNAHHITNLASTWMQVGKANVNGYRVTLIAKPPEQSIGADALKANPDKEKVHEVLAQYTQHFEVFVENIRLREPVPSLDVTLSARMKDGFRQDFTLHPRFGERGFHYGNNVRLTRRGSYELVVILAPGKLQLSEHSRRREEYFQTREVKFVYEYGYQGLKELMGGLHKRFSGVSGVVMGLGLPAPAKNAAFEDAAKRAEDLKGLAGLIPTLRFGEEQDRFVTLAEKTQKKTEILVRSLEHRRLNEAAEALAQVRISCNACHQVFRDGELAGR